MITQKLLKPAQARYAFYAAVVTGGRKRDAAVLAGYAPGGAKNMATWAGANPLVKDLQRALGAVTDADLVAPEDTDDDFIGTAA